MSSYDSAGNLLVNIAAGSGGGGGGGSSDVAIHDATTATQHLAIDASGRIGVNNFPATQNVVLPDGSTTGTVTNDNDAVSIALPGGQATALVQITGTFVGTLLFEASPDSGADWYSVYGNGINSSLALSTTGTGLWRVCVAGFTNFRVRLHPVTSGSASVLLRLIAHLW